MLKRLLITSVALFCITLAPAQELSARLTVTANKISTKVDKKIFKTLQTGLANFINNKKWTTDVFSSNEKIQCSFLLSVEQELGNNVYRGKLTVQAARPVYGSTYDSPIINFIDDNVVFRYQEFQPIEFNENRVQGNDPVAANLSAIFAYYINIILGLDYNSFSLRGGDVYLKKAWNIVNNAPEGAELTGWRSFESLRNRYWLAENLTSNRYALVHDAFYAYYRQSLDAFFADEEGARKAMLDCLNFLNQVNTDNPNSMILQIFFQGKSDELVNIFKKGTSDIKSNARELLLKLDITHSSTYSTLK